ncbi:hypothetical protein [Pseudonocardia asaccharolytica]|uniref:Thioredoxin-like fold domain-containing protein n=1 Tax=Pseudonocardia asaccharolytica DSM 44247 = NBRC 16224 TaxID=1123024 RepID=A0A511D131_9PSEU|nr:hypothetical protein [Pseudonocardia asaccharolytica]GEL18495.1 hypothetical protein PA7_23320 [Pseudonocardia asaccharolytica DSM 44247 = NBRC 16224]
MTRGIRELVVVYDVGCPHCSRIARELPDCVSVRVKVRSCRDPQLPGIYPNLRAHPAVTACAAPAIGVVRRDGSVRWWPGLTGAVGVLPVLRPGSARQAVRLLRSALRARA